MLEVFRLWLNGKKDYWQGVVLYAKHVGDTPLSKLFQKGETEFTRKKLNEEIEAIFQDLSNQVSIDNYNTQPTKKKSAEPTNKELYDKCKSVADLLYKEVMNKRAVLFSLAKDQDGVNINSDELVSKRSKLAVEVVVQYQRVSKLYDIADYVFKHGKMPNSNDEHEKETEMLAIPDELVKSTLDNLRKNINKMKRREQTAERMALLQSHYNNLKKLEERWQLLKPELMNRNQ